MVALTISGLRKEYGDVTALRGLDLDVEAGEVFGFLGPNGAGKSTAIDCVLDYVHPTAGSVEVLGLDSRRETRALHERVGVLPDGYELYDRLTGREHVELALDAKGATEDPMAVLKRVGIADAADRPAAEYSKGMSQRLALGMALVGDPDLLILDEPTTGLDPTGVRDLRELVRREAESGTTVVFSSHQLPQVEAVCDRVGILRDGELVAVDTVDALRAANGGGATVACAVPDPEAAMASGLKEVSGVESARIEDGSVVASCTEPAAKARVVGHLLDTGVDVTDLSVEEATLEDLFAQYAGDGDRSETTEGDREAAAPEVAA